MTVTANTPRADYNCNGVTTSFSVPFQFFLNTELQVIKTDTTVVPTVITTLALTTDYTVTGGAGANGSITTVATFPTGVKLSILMNSSFQQNAHYVPNDPFPATTHEQALDRLTLQDQQILEKLGRAAVLPPTVAGVNPALPVPTANAVLMWDPTGTFITNGTSGSTAFSSATPAIDTVAGTPGVAATVSRGDHAHPGPPASVVTFTQSGAGAVATTADAKFKERISVKDFGAKGDGVTDDTTAMRAAHATGKLVYYPDGTYKFTTVPGIASGGIVGDGQTRTILSSSDATTADLFTFTGVSSGGPANGLTFADFMIQTAPAHKTAGSAISISPTGGENDYASFKNVTTSYTPIGVDCVAAGLWRMVGCNFLGYTLAGVQVANTYSTDSGDSAIIGCVFSTTTATGTNSGIIQKSSGGLKVIGNKFLGGVYAYYLYYNVTTTGGGIGHAPTSVLNFQLNSCELYQTYAISLEQHGNTTFKDIIISGNEFGVQQGTNAGAIATDGSAAWLSNFVIANNMFDMAAPAGFISAIGLTNVSSVTASGNTFKFNGGTTPNAFALTGCTGVRISGNTYAGLSNSPFNFAGGGNTGLEITDQYNMSLFGAAVASAATITPTGAVFHVTGTTATATINLPYPGFTGSLDITADGLWTTTTAGNIAQVINAVAGVTYRFTYDGTKWQVSSLGSVAASFGGVSIGTLNQAGMVVDAGAGFFLRAKTGTTYDFAIANPANSAYLATVATGTSNWTFPGSVSAGVQFNGSGAGLVSLPTGVAASGTSASPAGTTSTTAVMMGLAMAFTPSKSGKVILTVCGQMANNTVNDGATVQLRYGTGTAPVNGAAVTGTQAGISQTHTSLVAADTGGFCISIPVTGLTLSTAYWLDIGLNAVTGGTATVTGVTVSASEL